MNAKVWGAIFLLFAVGSASSQAGQLQDKVEAIFSAPAFDHASVALSVRSLEDQQEVLNMAGDKRLIPASSLKLVTTLTAVATLGRDYNFRTRIGYTGLIDAAGTLDGDLIIIAGGDPTFASKRYGRDYRHIMQEVFQALTEVGIRCIEGEITVHTNVFSGQPIPASWPYGDVANYYGSGAWALNWNENEYTIYFDEKIPEGHLATVSYIEPEVPYLEVASEVITKGRNTGDNAYIYGDQYHYRKIVRGSVPYSTRPFTIRGSIPNPPLSFIAMLEGYLASKKIKVAGLKIEPEPIRKAEFKQLLAYSSPPLSQIIKDANDESINLYCEALLRMLGKKASGQGSIENGISMIKEAWQEMGINSYAVHMEDGSGLSPRNMITASSFTQYLSKRIAVIGRAEVMSYLPQAGVSGTVATLLSGKSCQKHFYLKSGSMGGVLSYTGVFEGQSGQWYALSFISNSHARGNQAVRVQAEKLFHELYKNL